MIMNIFSNLFTVSQILGLFKHAKIPVITAFSIDSTVGVTPHKVLHILLYMWEWSKAPQRLPKYHQAFTRIVRPTQCIESILTAHKMEQLNIHMEFYVHFGVTGSYPMLSSVELGRVLKQKTK